ncbi:MAG: hypothetical protein CMM25_06960 [Rhodospirillaceae bacterium]|nr:hypothetical protein [Rhodospirillaceae bacterium]
MERTTLSDTIQKLTEVVGKNNISLDTSEFSTDLFHEGKSPRAVVSPISTEQIPPIVKIINKGKFSIIPRGGGLSYTGGYVSSKGASIIIDTRLLSSIIEINETDMFVTVESGVTWESLRRKLQEKKLRTPFWGTGSGKYATVGATISQNAINYGSGQYGFAAQSVLGLEVVTANGNIIQTGSKSSTKVSSPFMRQLGPDLTSLFIGDCGALAIKSKITLQLVPLPKTILFGAYEYKNLSDFCDSLSDLARQQVVSECFGFNPEFMRTRTTYKTFAEKYSFLKLFIKSNKSIIRKIMSIITLVVNDHKKIETLNYSIHFCVEGRDRKHAQLMLKEAKRILEPNGKMISEIIPKVMREMPFPEPMMTIGKDGERWVPVHGIVPHSEFLKTVRDIYEFMSSNRILLETHGINWSLSAMPAGPSGILIEPNLYWQDEYPEMLRKYFRDDYLDNQKKHKKNVHVRHIVHKLRKDLVRVFESHNSVHMQIGRFYPFRENQHQYPLQIIRKLKAELDPMNIMNPGALGL